MNPQDSQLLQEFLDQLVQVRGVAKDPEAEAMIQRAVARQPDAAYLLVQRALLVQQALDNAKAEISALQGQLRNAPQASPAFLDPNAWGNSGTARPAPSTQAAPAYQQPYQPAYQQPYPAQPQPVGGPGGFLRGGLGGTMGTIAATAAGVAGGAFLFQGIENLLGHHGGNGLAGHQPAPASSAAADSSIGHAADASSNDSLAHKLGADNLLGSGSDTASGASNGLADFGGDFDDTSGDDGLFS